MESATARAPGRSRTGDLLQVKVEATSAIDVTGMSNSVTWKRGHGKSKPKISRTGMNNKVVQEK
ncbi:DUF3060 domain-containing protein [Corallococcus llansteffanensis]|uniref:DUF3060 domain-containing protein n=1 Tax=Corallococcus llansteffanensis TaxID=2316731 RepID=A0A3A8Q3X7_9BACT|nr:DUF3060 domain-containing protein [Corallococcus llansteffanensis]